MQYASTARRNNNAGAGLIKAKIYANLSQLDATPQAVRKYGKAEQQRWGWFNQSKDLRKPVPVRRDAAGSTQVRQGGVTTLGLV
jgi:hypothetical protein